MKKFYQVSAKSIQDLGATNIKEVWEKVKGEYSGLAFQFDAEFKAEEDNRFHFTFSTDSVDRHLDVVEQNFDLKSFKKNPVLLDSHNYDSIEHILGRIEKIKVKDGKLQGDVVFALGNPKGALANYLAATGFLNATSIGFIPLEFADSGNISKSELLEISAVSVPANPEALLEKMIKQVEVEEVDEVEEPEEEQAPETPQEEEIEGEQADTPETEENALESEPEANPSVLAYRAAVKLAQNHKSLMNVLAKELNGVKSSNKGEAQRKVYKAIRNAFKQR